MGKKRGAEHFVQINKDDDSGHDYAVVLLLAHGRVPEAGNPARQLQGAEAEPRRVEQAVGRVVVGLTEERQIDLGHLDHATFPGVVRLPLISALHPR